MNRALECDLVVTAKLPLGGWMKKSTENLSLTLSVYEADSAKIGIAPYLVVVKLSAHI